METGEIDKKTALERVLKQIYYFSMMAELYPPDQEEVTGYSKQADIFNAMILVNERRYNNMTIIWFGVCVLMVIAVLSWGFKP